MGLISRLRYEVKDANAIQRITQKVAASGPGAWVFQRTLYPVDKWLYRRTGGRLTVPGLLAGLPVIMLTTSATLLSPLAVPLVLGLALHGEKSVNVRLLADDASRKLLLTVVIPVVAGHLLSRRFPRWERTGRRLPTRTPSPHEVRYPNHRRMWWAPQRHHLRARSG